MSLTDLKKTARMLDEGRADEARRLLEEHVREAPGHTAAFVLLAMVAESQDDTSAALANWRRAYELTPLSPVVEKGLRRAALRELGFSDDQRPETLEQRPEADDQRPETLEQRPEADDQRPETDDERELEHLIRELEDARIIPDPDVKAIEEEELEDDLEDLVSETLARIYAAQKHYDEAGRVYDTLARQKPDRKNEFEAKAIEMKRLARESEK